MDDFNINAWSAGIGILLISAASIVISIITWRKSSQEQDYANLDTMYQTMLQAGIGNPKLRDPDATKGYPGTFSGNERYQYDAYVIMVLSFYESVWDNTIDDLIEIRGKKTDFEKLDKDLNWASYFPSFMRDLKLHWTWYEYEDNKDYFKIQFQNLIKEIREKFLT